MNVAKQLTKSKNNFDLGVFLKVIDLLVFENQLHCQQM